MQKEAVSSGQAFSLIVLFTMGTTATMGTAVQATHDSWAAILIAMAAAFPLVVFQVRLLNCFPGKDLFQIIETIMGPVFGKIVMACYTWYALILGSLVMRNFREFVHTVTLPETPEFITPLFMGILGIWLIRAGVEVAARSAKLLTIITLSVFAVVLILGIPQYDMDYLKPVLGEGLRPVLAGAFSAFAFPFAENIILLGAIFSLDGKRASYMAYIGGFIFAGSLLVILGIRNIVMLGPVFGSSQYFPSYSAVSRIKIGDFIQRIEGAVDIVFQTASFFKFSVCLLVASKGITRLFRLENDRTVVLPVGLVMMLVTQILFESVMEMRDFAIKTYPYYAFPFQVVLPVLIFVVFLVRNRKGKLERNS